MMEKYRDLHIKLTPQRLAILSFLDGNKSHPSAEDIYRAVLKKFPTMSFATVYNTLEALKNKGNIQELKIDSHKKRYDPDISRHHHLICIKCRKIIDIHKDFKIVLSEDLIHGFELLGNSVEFYGICQKCKKHH
ncbi:MAG TPA: transcriptional repressor [Nitrospirae bacterium]|nr:peroxide operon regulator [bacterium BMS3Abin06]GBE37442.1 peroxide operon regulator [bacterium BMS3Bbin08]HDH12232.1 transcriptional repressor [Nitrospirota bacterium]HDZ01108.1 transcriptional repressor [Nitrospirota bacterium]